jgi:hypothetical protein
MFRNQDYLRRLILIGTPLLTGFLLLFHPRPVPPDPVEFDVIALLAPVADLFLAVHVIFAPLLALLGLSIFLLLEGRNGLAAQISRISTFVFGVSYTVYETIVGTTPALLVRGTAALSPAEQKVISDAIHRLHGDPLLGDGPSVLFLVATFSWPLAVILAAITLHRSGKPLLACILLGLSAIFTFHASPLGTLGMLFFFAAVVGVERARSQVPEGAKPGPIQSQGL